VFTDPIHLDVKPATRKLLLDQQLSGAIQRVGKIGPGKSAWRLKSCAQRPCCRGVIDFNQDERCLRPSVSGYSPLRFWMSRRR
jgi:hypothetical protein